MANWTTKVAITKDAKGLSFNAIIDFYKDNVLDPKRGGIAFNGLSSQDQLDKVIANQIAQYDKVDATIIPNGDYTPKPPTPPPQPTPEEIAKAKYQADLRTLINMKKLVDLGIIDAGDKEYADQLQLVKDELIKPDYFLLVSGF